MMVFLRSVTVIIILGFAPACTQPKKSPLPPKKSAPQVPKDAAKKKKTVFIEACNELLRLKMCEYVKLAPLEPPPHLDCVDLKPKFETICSAEEIQYGFGVLKKDADTVCAMQTSDEVRSFKSAFDPSKVSAGCYQAPDSDIWGK
jgi:hypothetical protein